MIILGLREVDHQLAVGGPALCGLKDGDLCAHVVSKTVSRLAKAAAWPWAALMMAGLQGMQTRGMKNQCIIGGLKRACALAMNVF
ncbi:hypothetical protein AAW02_03120 [Aeromonas dhakensis]|nr:hypothetical protein AAW03_07060 [Aeromonas dhakensis]PHS90886.1 hypothetical protein AAW02_03120 [Aeromonas dhakensis]